MEIGSLFPSSDNPYKFLFMGGIFMIVFSFIYPLEKKQKIELEINLYNKQAELLNEEVLQLKKDVDKLKLRSKTSLKQLDSIKKLPDTTSASIEIKEIQDNFIKEFHTTKFKEAEIQTKNIILKYEKERILLLQNQVNSFSIFRFILLVVGFIFMIYGLVKWLCATKLSTDIQKYELEKLKKGK